MKKVELIIVLECGKRVKYIDIVKKKTCSGVLDRGERGDDNGTSLKEEKGIEMSTTVLPLRDTRSLSLKYLPRSGTLTPPKKSF